MKTKNIKRYDPSDPINLDSGQREELTYIIESLKKNITETEKESAGGATPSKDGEEWRKHSAVRHPVRLSRHEAAAQRNLLAVAKLVPA
jgi:hypothetical protein